MRQRKHGYTNIDVNRAFLLGLTAGLMFGIVLLLMTRP